MDHKIEISVGDVNDVEARVFARYSSSAGGGAAIVLSGTLRGPYCEGTRTLPAEFEFHDRSSAREIVAEVVVPDPCTWSPDLPHVYQADLEARRGDEVVAEYHGTIGLSRGRHV